MCNDKCKICRLRARVEVAGNDADIKREFDICIERNQQIIDLGDKLEAIDYLRAEQAKSPSAGTDGL